MWVTCGNYALVVCSGDDRMNTWELIKRQLESRLSSDSYQNWISKTEFSHVHDNKLCVAVPNEETRTWLLTEYSSMVSSILREVGSDVSGVVYELAENGRGTN